MATEPITLLVFPDVFAVCRLPPDAPFPTWAHADPFVSITRTCDELSIVCPQSHVPNGIRAEPGWRCLKVEGPPRLGPHRYPRITYRPAGHARDQHYHRRA